MNKKDSDLEIPLTSSPPLGNINEPQVPTNDDTITENPSEQLNIDSSVEKGEENNEPDSNSQNKNHDENYRLAGRPPLITLVVLTIGPLISQFVSSLYGVVATIWVSKALGEKGMAAVSLFTNLDNVGRAFGYFMNCSASQKISSLFGQKKKGEAGQVICDLLRCSFLSGIIVPATLIPVSKPLGKWFGADGEILQMGFDYLSVLLFGSTVSCLFLMFCGCLQAEGRTLFVSIAQISSFVMNMAIFCPLFLLVFKMGTKGAALATVVSEGIPTLAIFFLYFFQKDEDESNKPSKCKKCGKFQLACKPKLSGLFKKFSEHTWSALGVGVSQLASNCSRSIPSILQRKFIGMITQNNPEINFTDAMSGFNCVIRIAQLTDSFRLATSMSLLPTSSYAYSAGLYQRFLRLSFHCGWMNMVWGIVNYILVRFCAKPIAKIFSSSDSFLKASVPMMKNANTEAPIAWVRYLIQTFLQALSFGGSATVYSVLSYFVINIGTYCLLYYTDKMNVPRMMFAYSISAAMSIFIGAFFIIRPIKMIVKKMKEGEVHNNETDTGEANDMIMENLDQNDDHDKDGNDNKLDDSNSTFKDPTEDNHEAAEKV